MPTIEREVGEDYRAHEWDGERVIVIVVVWDSLENLIGIAKRQWQR